MLRKIPTLTACLVALFLMAKPADCAPLQGNVEHTDTMPAVDKKLLPGSVFNDAGLSDVIAGNHWVELPDWIAGTWLMTEETAVHREEYADTQALDGRSSSNSPFKFKARSRFSYGMQKDKRGHVWHYIGVPYTSATDFPEFVEYHQVKSKELVSPSETRVSFRTHVTVVRVSRLTGLVTDTYQQESITSYGPVTHWTNHMYASTKTFDASGKPLRLWVNEGDATQQAPFQAVDTQDGKNLQALFHAFLKGAGKEDLL